MPITQYNSSVRQMSQSKFNSMKNSNGKIPDLANQIVMTNSEDTNTSCLRTEVVYDMTSSDVSKNWGYTSGMDSGTTKSGIDLTPYKSLKITIATYAGCLVYFVDLKSTDLNGLCWGSACTATSDSGLGPLLIFGTAQTNSTKTSITVTSGFLRTNNNTVTNTYKTVKIEGILKTPSMIYTGDELIAGNGISIANGVISNITNILSSYYVRKQSAITTTSSIDITTGTFTKKSATSKIIVLASAYIQDSTGGYGSVLRVNIDGSEAVSSLSNTSKEHCILCPISNRASGNHTFSLQLVAGAGSATIPSYNDIYLTFLEVE